MNIPSVFLILCALVVLAGAYVRTAAGKRWFPTAALYLAGAAALAAGIYLYAYIPTPPVEEIPVSPKPVTQPPSGWQDEDGQRFYRREDGTRATGWLELDGKRYYLGDDGAARTGWQTVENRLYFFREDGSMARGNVEIDGVSRHFTADGAEILLTNLWNPVPEGYLPALAELDSYYGKAGMQVDPVCLEDLTAMIDACNATGARAYVISAYRSFEQQQELFEKKVARLMAAGASRADAETEAATVVLVPGTSEHHLGLAVDIIDTRLWALDERQADMPAQQWLMENSWRYGFILRYPPEKTAVTGIIYEPWHYRYVGRELAAELYETGLTLEEYLAGLN